MHMESAYVVGQISVENAQLWADYKSQVSATLEPFGAQIMFRGEHAGDYAGQSLFSQIVVIRFDSLALADHWFESEAYQALIPLREKAARVQLSVFKAS